MAGVSAGPHTGGRRKSLDAEINLVPFIDLLSMCISFLLLTAVWINIGAVQIKQTKGTEATPVSAQQFELSLSFIDSTSVEVGFKNAGKIEKRVLKAENEQALVAQLNAALSTWNETKNAQNVSSVRISPKTSVPYGDLVDIIDVFRKHQIVNLAVLPGSDT